MKSNNHSNNHKAGATKAGDYLLIQERPCQITEVLPIKSGKDHGKIRLFGKDLLTDEVHKETFKQSDTVLKTGMMCLEYDLDSIEADGSTSLSIPGYMDDCLCDKSFGCYCEPQWHEEETRHDIIVSNQELRNNIINADNSKNKVVVTVMEWQGMEAIISFKVC